MSLKDRPLFSDEHRMFRDAVRRFVQERVVPCHDQWEKDRLVPRSIWLEAGAQGLLCCDVPERFGGPGGEFLHGVIVTEELAYAGCTGVGFMIQTDVVAPYLCEFGNDTQRARWLPKMASGEAVGAIGMTEPDAGSDLRGIKTTARRDGDEYIIKGQKLYITNGYVCDFLVLVARTGEDVGGRGLSLFIVESDRLGFVRGKKLDKMGNPAQDVSELFFDNVRIPAANRLGEEGTGFGMLMKNLARERLAQALRSARCAEAALDMTIPWVKGRTMFRKTLADFQNTRFELADIATKAAACRALVDRCLTLHLQGQLTEVEAGMVKMYATQFHGEAVDRCLQLHGGAGYIMESPIARAYTVARVARIAGGSIEVMKEFIGRDLLKD